MKNDALISLQSKGNLQNNACKAYGYSLCMTVKILIWCTTPGDGNSHYSPSLPEKAERA